MKFKNREEKIERKKKEKRERRKGKGRKKGKKEEKSKKVLNFLPCYDIFSSLSQKIFRAFGAYIKIPTSSLKKA